MPTQAVFYRDGKGREPVREFLHGKVAEKSRLLIEEQINEMNGLPDNAPPIPFPQTSQVEGGLRELRCHSGRVLYRILYRRSGNLFVLLHIFRKESRAAPRRDVDLAQRRWSQFRHEMDNPHRRGPRPAGQDAP